MAYFPRIFRTGVTENVMVSTLGFPGDVNITVQVSGPTKTKQFITKASKIVAPGW